MTAFSSMRNCLFKKLSYLGVLSGLSFGLMLPVHAQTAKAAAVPAAQATAKNTPVFVDGIVAVVNSGIITRRDVEARLQDVEKRLTGQGIALPPRTQLRKQLLERMIVEQAQIQLAKDGGITVDDAMVDRAVAGVAEQNNMTLPQFRVQLEKEGLTYLDFREEIRREILMQRVRERNVNNAIQISESEIDNYLSAEANASGGRDELHLAHIVVAVPENASSEQVTQRRQRADQILERLNRGEDFAKTAATFSDSGDALNGGDLGWRGQDRLPQLFVDAAANLTPGQVTPVTRSANGFHIIKLVERRATKGGKAQGPVVQQTHARHILIKVNQLVSAGEARRKLAEIKERLDNKSATFEDLAKQYSNDLSASQGGDLGWIYPGDTVPTFERAMNELQPGQVSEPIESPFGFHLIQVLERKTDDASVERTRQAVRQAIRERKVEEATEAWLRELRDSTYVEYRDEAYH